jgi:hypothetical protein
MIEESPGLEKPARDVNAATLLGIISSSTPHL